MPQQVLQDQINEARHQGYSDDDILSHLENNKLVDINKSSEARKQGYSSSEVLNYLSPSEIIQKATPAPVTSIAKTITGNLPSAQTLTEMGTGALAGGPVGASAAMALTSRLFDPELKNKDLGTNTIQFGKDFLLNEVFGRLLSGAGKVGSEVISPGSVTGEEMQKLLPYKPTFAQLTESKAANLTENIFAAKQKQDALNATAKIINEKGESLIQQLTGRSKLGLDQPFKQELNIEEGLENQFDLSKFESSKRGTATNLIANANITSKPIYEKVPSMLMPGQFIIQQVGTRNVKGEIFPVNLSSEAQNLLATMQRSKAFDPNLPTNATLAKLISESQELDINGNVTTKSWDFGDAWETKKALDDIAYNNPKSQQTFSDIRFKKLAQAINQDIEDSIPNWQNQSGAALSLWNESKQIVATRNELFGKAPIEKVINEEDRSISNIDKIIKNPTELKKAVLAGHLQIPDQGNFTYITNNTRKDLASYEITQILNRAKQTDDKGNFIFDGQKLMRDLLDPNKQESYNLLFGSARNPNSTRVYLEDFFKNISQVQSGDPTGLPRYMALRLTGAGLTIGTGLIAGFGMAGLPYGASIIGGTIGLNAVGKLFANPTYAKILATITSNKGNLGMPIAVAGRILAQGLRNTPMELYDEKGNKIEGKINGEGKFVIPINK